MPHPNGSAYVELGSPGGMLDRARLATTALFFATGAIYAAWATRIPDIKEDLGLSGGQLGLAILGLEAGAILGLPGGGALVARRGSRTALRIGFVAYTLSLTAVGLAPGLAALTAALAAMAAATSVVDVAVNAQGVELERRYERPVLSGMHAGHSFGLVAGGLAGTAAAAAALDVRLHFGATTAVGLALAALATARLVEEPCDGDRPAFARPRGRLLALGVLGFCAFLLDGTAYNWSAVHLRETHGAAPGLAAAAFTLFSLALALGRLGGDRLVARLGRPRLLSACGAVTAAGAAIVVAAPSAGAALAGWIVVGAGLAAVAPTVLGAAGVSGEASPPVAIAAVTTVGYLGSFTGPPLVGALADLTTLPAALGLMLPVALAMMLLARRAPA
jgi:MFS family permease